MKDLRKIALSIHKQLRDKAEDGSLFGAAYHVYTEADIRAGTVPEFPYLYLLDYGVLFEQKHLPVIVVHPTVYLVPFEMGNLAYFVDLNLHIFGRDRGQRYDIPAAIMESLSTIAIRDFDHDPAPLVETAEIADDEDGKTWAESHHVLPQDLALEESLANWVTLSAALWVLSRPVSAV